jgi:hypothetical protein
VLLLFYCDYFQVITTEEYLPKEGKEERIKMIAEVQKMAQTIDRTPPLKSDFADGDDSDIESEEEQEDEPTYCVFCSALFNSPFAMAMHCSRIHKFNLSKIKQEHSIVFSLLLMFLLFFFLLSISLFLLFFKELKFYDCIKLINFLRTKFNECECTKCFHRFPTPSELNAHAAVCGLPFRLTTTEWNDETYRALFHFFFFFNL